MNIQLKKFAFLFIFGCLFLFAFGHSDSLEFQIQNVVIYAESNAMNFKLKYSKGAVNQIQSRPIHYSSETGKCESRFEMQIDEFEAPNKLIKSDFEEMVRADEFPEIHILMEDFCIQNIEDNKPEQINIHLQIGGVDRKVIMEYNSTMNSDSTQIYTGTGRIHLSDFGLSPPKHFFGLIKVKDIIMITFEVKVFSL